MSGRIDYFGIVKHTAQLTTSLFIVVLILSFFDILSGFWNLKYFFFVVVLVNTVYLTFKINEIPEDKIDDSRLVWVIKHLFILVLIIIVLNQFLKINIVFDFMVYIITLVIVLGFLAFYANNKKIEKELEDEKHTEAYLENKRDAEFPNKFQRINKIPILRNIVKWGYKEGGLYCVGLIIIIAVGLITRIASLKAATLWIDEITSLIAIENIINKGIPLLPSGLFYSRGLLFHYFLASFKWLFDLDTNGIRFLVMIVGLGVIFLTYIFIKKISNKNIALISAIIISLLSFEIVWSIQLRFYIFLQFFSLLILISYIKFKEGKTKHIILLFIYFILLLLIDFQGISILFIIIMDISFNKKTRIELAHFLNENKFIFISLLVILLLAFFFGTIWKVAYIVFKSIISHTNNYEIYKKLALRFFPYLFILILIAIPSTILFKKKLYKFLDMYIISLLIVAIFLWTTVWMRYIYIAIPFVIFSISYLLLLISKLIKNKIIAVFILLFLLSPFFIKDFYTMTGNPYKMREATPNFERVYGYIYDNMDNDTVIISITTANDPAYYVLKDKFYLEKNYVLTYLVDLYGKDYLVYKDMDGVLREGYTNSRIISNYTQLVDIMSSFNKGFIVFDQQKIYHIDDNTRELLKKLKFIKDFSDEEIKLYEWGQLST